MKLSLKFALFTSVLCLVIIGAITYISYRISFRDVERSLGERLQAIVATGAIQIDGTLHDSVLTPEDADSEAFLTIRDQLRAIKEANGLAEEVYTFRRVGETLEFVVMTNEKPFIGATNKIHPAMWPTLNDARPAYTGVYTDAHGVWISAFAPVFDNDGNISGLLEADFEVGELLALVRKRSILLLIKAGAFGLLAVIASFLLATTVTRRIVRLTEATEKISLGRMDMPIDISGRDEVAKLASSLDRMRESVRVAAEMLDEPTSSGAGRYRP